MARLSGPFIPAIEDAAMRRLRLVDASDTGVERRAITVLHIGDTPEDTFLIGRLVGALPSFAATFVAAGTREAALSALSRQPCDVVLCEFWMAGRTTMALIDEIKRVSDVPVILTSALDNDDIELIGRRAGADGLLTKSDLAVATLDRIFSTLLPRRQASRGDAAAMLRALMSNLYAAGLALRPQRGNNRTADQEARRTALARSIADLEAASRFGAGVQRFDAIPFFVDAVKKQDLRAEAGGNVTFLAPSLPLPIETSPTLYADLVEGFLAEAGDAAAAGGAATVSLRASAGRLIATVRRSGREPIATDAEARAAAAERRLLIEGLARACGGVVTFSARNGHVLEVPLRLSSPSG
ncbi:two-component system response regulator [Pleomorphomonas sp. NRK KF1]|uniref:response regulator n=1 Tax=Pleomorphomonas sp. NRK KF1 TaxID=2943000 RepID=UPI0020430EDE|nr:response regulator [Pleomorphomonas sp. NRK KF1]MCM5554599.1 response regulator [Pleomorphomonas sp. NRK KF1]